jgi:exonuclease 1
LPSTRIEDSSAPDSVEDTNLPTNHSQASQSSSEQLYSQPSPDVSAASQCSCERFSCEDPSDNSANISSQCSSLDGNIYPPPEDTCIEDKKVFVFHHFII